MKKRFCSLMAAAGCLALMATAATSATYSFSLDGEAGVAESYAYSVNGLDLTVTAGAFEGGWMGDATQRTDENGTQIQGYVTAGNTYDADGTLSRWDAGIGVINNVEPCGDGNYVCSTDDRLSTDGSVWDDFVILSFSEEVRVTGATFTALGTELGYRLFYDTNNDGILADGDFLSYRQSENPSTLFPGFSTRLMGFAATSHTDNWMLSGVEVDFTETKGFSIFANASAGNAAMTQAGQTPAAVPLPVPGLMLLAGLGGLAALRRRNPA